MTLKDIQYISILVCEKIQCSEGIINPRARAHDGHAGPPPGLKMRARPQQIGQSRHSCPLLNALIGAGTHARALAAVERV